MLYATLAATLLTAATAVEAGSGSRTPVGPRPRSAPPPPSRFARAPSQHGHVYPEHVLKKRQLPAAVTDQINITSPNGVPIRYKDTTGTICELTPGVKSYAGYVDLAADRHSFFYFFEARNNPQTAPITLWLNGGPGSDSMIGLFQENGPCKLDANLNVTINPYSWNENSNMIYLSQPYGVGYSYQTAEAGTLDPVTGSFVPASIGGVDGRYGDINQSLIATTDEAAVVAWEAIQALIPALTEIDANVTTREFNLATESYGGHYGPAFFNYFTEQSQAIANGSAMGTQLTMNSLTIINGIIDQGIQAPYYPIFANNNTYGITALNDTVYNYAVFANAMSNGCQDQIEFCRETNRTSISDYALCSEAQSMCRDNVEGVYYQYGGRGVYDIRAPYDDTTLVDYFADYLNLPEVMQALGSDVNYTTSNDEVYFAFQQTGDFAWQNFREDLEAILDRGVKVSMIYGDADYICNWFGGEAVSLALNYTDAEQFRAAGYVPMTVNGTEYGETRGYGNFSFTRVYESGHEVPAYQPIAALALFERTIQGLALPDGSMLMPNSSTSGMPTATHTETFVALPSSTMASSTIAAASAVGNTTVPRIYRRAANLW